MRLKLNLAFLPFMLFGCVGTVIVHDEDKAAAEAVKFVKAAFVDGNAEAAYRLLSDATRSGLTPEKFSDVVKQMHPQGRPDTIEDADYEFVPGKKGMKIYVTGRNNSEVFYYQIAMEGTLADGYKPWSFYRGSQPYPSSGLRHKLTKPVPGVRTK